MSNDGMKTYRISGHIKQYFTIDIEAESADAAEDKIEDMDTYDILAPHNQTGGAEGEAIEEVIEVRDVDEVVGADEEKS